MAGIDNLTGKILEEANIKEKEILTIAKEERDKILQKKIHEAKEIEKETLERAIREAEIRKERILSNAQLQVRNKKLEVKQQIIEKVFNSAVEELCAFSKNDYLNYIKERTLSLDISGDEKLIVNQEIRTLITDNFLIELNSELLKKGKKGIISLSEEVRSFKGGFILEKDGIEINNTFEALVSSIKDELEYEVAKVLFD
ncbi:V-type ATP synthase subunit E [Clostridium polyendosporum]|uniref:V-type proton ATPase subunit E n=1 Tax=Clostridium polyendosporum TaxID=69208 RepID=A0A919VHC9_9CLOT|nr:V-type ATP synthase subunit E family protein [Clostridium polyendosporum]GIM29551.1 V-type ATP synthase subunit E [Clostridium polyendosporum]